jgi:hypothetical protein
VSEFLGLGLSFGPGISEATGQHPGGEHHGIGDSPAPDGAPASSPVASTSPGGDPTTIAVPAAPASTPASLPVSAREG